MRALVWAGAIGVAAIVLVAGLAVSGMLDGFFGKQTLEDQEQSLWDDISIDGMWTNVSYSLGSIDYEGGPIPVMPSYDGYVGGSLQAGVEYFFTVEAPATDYGVEWFRSHLTQVNPGFTGNNETYTLDGTAMPYFVVEITSPSGVSADDVKMVTARPYQLGGTRITSPQLNPMDMPSPNPQWVDFDQVDGNTVRGVLSEQPWAYFHSFGGAGANYVNGLESVNDSYMRALCFNGIEFVNDGNYTMTFYLADTSNSTIDRNLTSTTTFSPSVQYSAEVNPPSIIFNWGFYSDAYPKWMAYINDANDQVCWKDLWIYGGIKGWYNGTVKVKASVDNGAQFVTVNEDGKAQQGLGPNITLIEDWFFRYNIGKFPQAGNYTVTLTAYDSDTGQQITEPYTNTHRVVLLEDASTTWINLEGGSNNGEEFNRTFVVYSETEWATYKGALVYPSYIIEVTDEANTTTIDTSTMPSESYSWNPYNVSGRYPASMWWSPVGLPGDPFGLRLTIDFRVPGAYTMTVTPLLGGELAGNVVQYTVTIP